MGRKKTDEELVVLAGEIAEGVGSVDEKLRAICAAIREKMPGYDWVGHLLRG